MKNIFQRIVVCAFSVMSIVILPADNSHMQHNGSQTPPRVNRSTKPLYQPTATPPRINRQTKPNYTPRTPSQKYSQPQQVVQQRYQSRPLPTRPLPTRPLPRVPQPRIQQQQQEQPVYVPVAPTIATYSTQETRTPSTLIQQQEQAPEILQIRNTLDNAEKLRLRGIITDMAPRSLEEREKLEEIANKILILQNATNDQTLYSELYATIGRSLEKQTRSRVLTIVRQPNRFQNDSNPITTLRKLEAQRLNGTLDLSMYNKAELNTLRDWTMADMYYDQEHNQQIRYKELYNRIEMELKKKSGSTQFPNY